VEEGNWACKSGLLTLSQPRCGVVISQVQHRSDKERDIGINC